jgi:hypothetical protein
MSLHKAQKFIINAEFSKSTRLGDIALIKVREEINFKSSNGLSSPACLPPKDLYVRGHATASGWGQTAELGADSEVLLAIDLPIVTQEYCKSKFGPNIKDTVFCAGSIEGKDTCLVRYFTRF